MMAVRSCLSASKPPSEILIIASEFDDQHSLSLQELNDAKIKLMFADPDASLAQKLQLGLESSQEEYVARMDSDDICLPWRWSRQIATMEKTSAAAMFSTAIVFGKELKPFPVLPQPPIELEQDDIAKGIVLGNPLVHPTLFARRDHLLRVGGYQDSPAEDLHLWLRLLLSEARVRRDYVPVLLYRFHRRSMSRAKGFAGRVSNDQEILALRSRLAIRLIPSLGGVASESDVVSNFSREVEKGLRLRIATAGFGMNT